MRKIPTVMATQHPDNAQAPFWNKKGGGFVNIYDELEEAMICWRDLGIDEFMWDWEGKYADEAVIDKLFSANHGYFRKHHLGSEKYLTFRLPNVWKEKGYSLIRALMVILTSEDFAADLKYGSRPLFEVILPMTEKAEQLSYIQTAFRKLARFKGETFNHNNVRNNEYIEMIPLVESVESQMNAGRLLEEYTELHSRHFGKGPEYIRIFLARSDPALISGLPATVLANKAALAQSAEFSRRTGVRTFPILGAGSLIFRGGLSPERIPEFIREYPGISTVTMQSAFRYDFPRSGIIRSVKKLSSGLRGKNAQAMLPEEMAAVKDLIAKFSASYRKALDPLLKEMEPFFSAVPSRRERRQHIGLLGYGRKAGNMQLPRAINFTAAFYSVGIPPEFIGLGRMLRNLSPQELSLLKKYYVNFSGDMVSAGRYFNRENLRILGKRGRGWRELERDFSETEKLLGKKLGPATVGEMRHRNLASNILLLRNKPGLVSRLITETGIIRKSLG